MLISVVMHFGHFRLRQMPFEQVYAILIGF